MKKVFAIIFFLSACATATIPMIVPPEYVYKEISTPHFTLATWQKIINKTDPIKIYIEGDGNSFNAYGRPTRDPTPKGTFLREKAFNDKYPNVVYMARPCQFIKDSNCQQIYWTTGRFAANVINSTADAVRKVAKGRKIEFIAFSGGSQVAGLVSVMHQDIDVVKITNYAPNLDHVTWTEKKKLYPLSHSLSLNDYREEFLAIEQINYIAEDDRVIPAEISLNFLDNNPKRYRIIKDVGHNFR